MRKVRGRLTQEHAYLTHLRRIVQTTEDNERLRQGRKTGKEKEGKIGSEEEPSLCSAYWDMSSGLVALPVQPSPGSYLSRSPQILGSV